MPPRRAPTIMSIDKGNSMTFLRSVCTGVRRMASPKQPQSPIGRMVALRSVTMVKSDIIAIVAIAVMRWGLPLSKSCPRVNSTTESTTAIGRAKGSNTSSENVARYFSTKTAVPTGSTHFTIPEKLKTPPSIQRKMSKMRSLFTILPT